MKPLRIVGVLVALVLLGGLARAQSRQVCLDDQAGLNTPALGAFYKEFQSLAGSRGVQLVEADCAPDSIRLSVYKHAPVQETSALGAARLEGSRIAPRLEIYLDRVEALLPESQCWNVVGRALARVAAHELAHYFDQAAEHNEVGLLQSRFSASELGGADSYPFRWTARH